MISCIFIIRYSTITNRKIKPSRMIILQSKEIDLPVVVKTPTAPRARNKSDINDSDTLIASFALLDQTVHTRKT